MKVTDDYVFFWKESPFCNFTRCVINYDGNRFSTSEQLFMWMKAKHFNDDKTAGDILRSGSPDMAKRLGRMVRNYDDAEWDRVRVDYMYTAVLEKFNQNQSMREKLCDSQYDGKQFVEASGNDDIWGIGYNEDDALTVPEKKWGRNELGKVLNRVRDSFK